MNFFERFQESPFGPMDEHMKKVKECVSRVMPMFECIKQEDYTGLQTLAEEIFKHEHDADLIKNEIRRRIPRSFFLPVYRGDLLAYLKVQDDIADSVEDLAVQLTIKHLPLPAAMADEILDYVQLVINVCEDLYRVTDQLPALVQGDFGGERTQEVVALAEAAEQAEWKADKAEYSAAKRLFSLEDELRATDIYLWSQILITLGDLANHAEKTGDRLRRMLAR